MPYIQQRIRDMLNTVAPRIMSQRPQSSGELNYLITQQIDDYIKSRGMSYTTLNTVVGVLECAKLELYRRVAAPYEDEKLAENGDVYHANTKGPEQERQDSEAGGC